MVRGGSGERDDRVGRSPKVAEHVARNIVDSIADRGLQPGDVLPSESALVDQYQVGRSSLREALLLLEVMGLISRKPGPKGGPIVGTLSAFDFASLATLYFRMAGITYRQLIEARLLLVPMSARLAAEQADPEFLDRLRAAIAETGQVDPNDDRRYLDAVVKFHSTIAAGSGNAIIDFVAQALAAIYSDQIAGGALSARESRRGVIALHQRLAGAILDGDGELAERLALDLMEGTVERLATRFGDQLDSVIEWT